MRKLSTVELSFQQANSRIDLQKQKLKPIIWIQFYEASLALSQPKLQLERHKLNLLLLLLLLQFKTKKLFGRTSSGCFKTQQVASCKRNASASSLALAATARWLEHKLYLYSTFHFSNLESRANQHRHIEPFVREASAPEA